MSATPAFGSAPHDEPAARPQPHETGGADLEHTRAIAREVDRIAKIVERMNLGDYLGLLQRPGRLLWLNFLAGLARGLGGILGATLLVSLIIAIAHRIIQSNLPGVSEFFSRFVHLLQQAPKGH